MACESFIKERLRSPSTYERVSADDSGIPFESRGKRLRLVNIEYDAQNAYGTPVRDSQVCTFDLDKNDKLVDDPMHLANLAAISADRTGGLCCEKDPPTVEDMLEEAMSD